MRFHRIACLLLVSSLAACGSYFAPDINLKRKASEKEIVGTWKLTSQTRDLLKAKGFADEPSKEYTITFASDGSLQFSSIMEDAEHPVLMEGAGNWTLEHDLAQGDNIKKANDISLKIHFPKTTYWYHLFLTEENGKLLLWYWYGDPDSWEFIKYERIETK